MLFVAGACGAVVVATLNALRIRFPSLFGTAHGLLAVLAFVSVFVSNLIGERSKPDSIWCVLGLLAASLSGTDLLEIVAFRA